MAECKTGIFIAAAPERVFEIFTDLAGSAERVSAITRVEILSDGPVGLGTRWRQTRKMFGQEASEVMTISEFEPPRYFASTAESHGSKYYSRFDFEAKEGGTYVTMTFRGEPVSFFAKAMSVFSGLMMKSVITAMNGDLDDLRKSAEESDAG